MDTGNNDLIFYLLIGSSVFFSVLSITLTVLIFRQKKKIREINEFHDEQEARLLSDTINIEETEKLRFSRYLHNELISAITDTKKQIEDINTANDPSNARHSYHKAISLLDNVIDRIQTTAWHFPSRILRKYGINEAIKYFTGKISDNKKVTASFQLDPSFTGLNEEKDIILFRIFQEIIINIMKHASPGMIAVSTDVKENELELIILNDGKGLTHQDVETIIHNEEGPGLTNIHNRVRLLGGTISFHYKNNEQKIVLMIPLLNTA